ncbi:hypothetical protein [Kosakonia pseudosacchari]|uniref:hypothetical protein n=1 Tax=Kosakonia pseudosacchari TaxID=1646340 RepID=UPI000A3A5DBD|nr:hypothetical protein [Kosakonia pseudosacchari]
MRLPVNECITSHIKNNALIFNEFNDRSNKNNEMRKIHANAEHFIQQKKENKNLSLVVSFNADR